MVSLVMCWICKFFRQRLVSLASGRQPDDTPERCRDLWRLPVDVQIQIFVALYHVPLVHFDSLISCSMDALDCSGQRAALRTRELFHSVRVSRHVE
jgi:hypothetical protein